MRSVNSDLIVGRVTVRQTQVKVLRLQVHEGEDQLQVSTLLSQRLMDSTAEELICGAPAMVGNSSNYGSSLVWWGGHDCPVVHIWYSSVAAPVQGNIPYIGV